MSVSSTESKPVFVLVPGSFSSKESYVKVVDLLSAREYESVPIDFPSAAGGGEYAPTMSDDAACIHQAAESLAEEGKDIVLVAHSYSGLPVTESARGLLKTERSAAGKRGGIISIVYIAAFMFGVGESVMTAPGAGGEASWISPNGQWMHITDIDAAAAQVFPDLSPSDARYWASKLRDQSSAAFVGELTYPAYLHLPVFYIVTTEDKVVSPERQRMMIEMRQNEGAKVNVTEIAADHAPILGAVEKVVDVLIKASLS
ncbi:MAG: hypothetical protein Q9227_003333 [Pyrenula ochraceoflavens]